MIGTGTLSSGDGMGPRGGNVDFRGGDNAGPRGGRMDPRDGGTIPRAGSVSSSSPRMSNWTSWGGSAVPIEPQDWRGGYTSINPTPPSQQHRVPRDDQPPFNRVQQSPLEDGERNRFTAFNKVRICGV